VILPPDDHVAEAVIPDNLPLKLHPPVKFGCIVHNHAILTFRAGAAFIRAPCATASTVAAAASIRPKERAFASL
jgi:hypothetical protein